MYFGQELLVERLARPLRPFADSFGAGGASHAGGHLRMGKGELQGQLGDIAAARAVFAAPWEITIAPLDTCGTLTLAGPPYEAVAASQSPLAKVTIENYDQWTNRKQYAADASSVLFDTLGTYLCYSEELVKMETIKLSIDDRGATVVDETNGRAVRCALRWKDRLAFEKHLIGEVTR